jgi:phenylacetate-CoA ligase
MAARTKSQARLSRMKSSMPGIAWPAVATGASAVLASLLQGLELTQWLPAAEIAARQLCQLGILARHANKHSPHFRARLKKARLKPGDLEKPGGLARLPVLQRRTIQSSGTELFCNMVPDGHAPISETKTSGSTGEPVTVRRTAVSQLDWLAMTLREHVWHGSDFSGRLAAVRAGVSQYVERSDWGPPASLVFHTGPSAGIPIRTDIARLLERLTAFGPNNLLVYPSVLEGLTAYCRGQERTLPGLTHIRCVSETLLPHVRREAAAVFGARVSDCYSSQEAGYIALECPDSGLYHVMAETLIVEILDEHGRPCREGEMGRVTLTDLHNFATPIVRYDIADYAVPGGTCPCGRGLPTLSRILGRRRNLVLMPDGSRHWPMAGFQNVRDIAPIRQSQFVQLDRERIEVRLAVDRALTAAETDAVRAMIEKILGHAFTLEFRYFDDRIPAGPGGKFEHFVCEAE